MDTLLGKARPLLGIAVLVAIAGLLLPAYAPLWGISYGEMLPEHHHIVLAGPGAHVHDYAPPTATEDVLAVPAPDDSSAFAIVVAVGAALLLLRSSAPLGPRLRRLGDLRTRRAPRGMAIAPVTPPPRLFPAS